MNKPVIGILVKHYKNNKSKRLETYIRDEVEQAIFDNGGIAIGILPPNEDKIAPEDKYYDQLTTTEKHNSYDQIRLCDGIILHGEGFIDEYECFIAKYCYEYDIPILGICAGKHVKVKAVGGKRASSDNKSHDSQEKYVHSINISKDSKFYEIVGKEEIMVNSRHIGYSSNFGSLKAAAYSSDGIDEVVEDKEKRFYIGVQFYSESLYKTDENMNNIFKYFLN